ncbi:WAP domain containing protein, SLPI-like [Trichuris trichiura]|uniref:WAP domain containing protein, SLPI-like n=1 Tax=Trichuris trichiura TaxID=36087 RepID=A0A077Z0W7_TRITR|nr:WAP domain containing protein, SLPI-like [Trichuris trichiura]
MDSLLISLKVLLICAQVGVGEKPGLCPPTPPGEISPDAKDECTVDEDCPGREKCCQTLLGKICLEPEPDNGRGPNRDLNGSHTKPGECPVSFRGLPAGPPCDCDRDCESNLKCCSFGGRQRCVFPKDFTAGTVSLSEAFAEKQNGQPYLPIEGSPIIGPPIESPQIPSMYGEWNANNMATFGDGIYEQNLFSSSSQNHLSNTYLGGTGERYEQMFTQNFMGYDDSLMGSRGYGPTTYDMASAGNAMAYSHTGQAHYDPYATSYYQQHGYSGTYGQIGYGPLDTNFGDPFSASITGLG